MDLLFLGLKTAVQPYYLLMAFIGAFLGVAFGAIPGINAIFGVALLIPMTLSLDPIAAFILLGAVYTGGAVGGACPAILFKMSDQRVYGVRFNLAVLAEFDCRVSGFTRGQFEHPPPVVP